MHQTSLNFDSHNLLSDEEAVLSCLGHGRQAATSSTEIEASDGVEAEAGAGYHQEVEVRGAQHRVGNGTPDGLLHHIGAGRERGHGPQAPGQRDQGIDGRGEVF